MNSVLVAWTTFPTEAVARQIGTMLVEKQCAACVHLLPVGVSLYRWEGGLETGAEVLAMLKTTRDALPRLRQVLAEAHPYACPELVAHEVVDGIPAYLDWVRAETGAPRPPCAGAPGGQNP